MLKTIHPLLNADVLHCLAAMGHGDTIVLSDSNFPAATVAASTTSGRLLRMDGVTAPQAAEALLTLLPLDTFVDDAVQCMQIIGASADERPPVQQEVQAVIDKAETQSFKLTPVERYEFYERAKQSFAVIACGEARFYGCFIFTKGVIGPD